MAERPSEIASSAAQAPIQSRELGKEQAARRAGQAHAAARHTRTVDESGVIVETDDSDTQIFADSEGTGGMGRDQHDEKETPAEHSTSDSSGIVRGDDGTVHVDLEA